MVLEANATVGEPISRYVRARFARARTIVVIAGIDPPAGWAHVLPSHRSDELARCLRRLPDTLVCHLHVQTV